MAGIVFFFFFLRAGFNFVTVFSWATKVHPSLLDSGQGVRQRSK